MICEPHFLYWNEWNSFAIQASKTPLVKILFCNFCVCEPTCMMALSSEFRVHLTTAGKAEFIIWSDNRFFCWPIPDARTTVSRISNEIGWSPDMADFSGPAVAAPPPSRMETRVGTSFDSSGPRHPGVWARTLKMSWVNEVITGSENVIKEIAISSDFEKQGLYFKGSWIWKKTFVLQKLNLTHFAE